MNDFRITPDGSKATPGAIGFQTLAQAVLHHSRERPQAPALVSMSGETLEYQRFARLVASTADALREMDLGPGNIVGVCCVSRTMHLALLLAIESVGAASVSLPITELHTKSPLFLLCNFVFSDVPHPRIAWQRAFGINPSWTNQILKRPVSEASVERLGLAPGHNGFVRYTSTSGTTGTPKILGVTQSEQMRISETHLAYPEGLLTEPRLLALYSFAVETMYKVATSCLLMGGTLIFGKVFETHAFRHRPNLAWVIPRGAETLLQHLPQGFTKPESFVVICGGAPVPDKLRTALLERLASRVIERYATNETSLIGVRGDDGSFDIVPGVDVDIVDEDGHSLPVGASGAIRIRTQTMLSGYHANPEETAQRFKDGWFTSNDMGCVDASGRLRLLGRIDEILNIGGAKVSPFVFESGICTLPGVQAAMCVSCNFAGSIETLCVVLVVSPGTLHTEIEGLLMAKYPVKQRDHIRFVDALPLTEIGKPDRRAAQALFQHATQQPG